MNPSPCHSLDDYLAHDLTGAELARFTAHLPDCPGCRRAVYEYQRLDALLTAAVRQESMPAGVMERVGRRLRTARRRRVVAVAAALAATIAVVWFFGRPAPQPDKPGPVVAQVQPEPPAPEPPRPADLVRVSFPASANLFAVPVKTESPNVTFLWVFPDRRAASVPAPAEDGPPSSPQRSDS